MVYIPPLPPSKEKFLANPDYYWNELRKDQLKLKKMNYLNIIVIAFIVMIIAMLVGLFAILI